MEDFPTHSKGNTCKLLLTIFASPLILSQKGLNNLTSKKDKREQKFLLLSLFQKL